MNFPDSPPTSTVPSGRGKFAVIGMLLVAVLAATFAWWWNFNRGRESLHFFGPQAARLIRTAQSVEILVPVADESHGEAANSAMRTYGVQAVQRIDVSRARGLIHARTSLLNDSSYSRVPSSLRHVTAYFIRFSDSGQEILLGFTEPDGAIQIAESGEYRQLIPKTAGGWRSFIKRNVESAKAESMPPAPARTAPSE